MGHQRRQQSLVMLQDPETKTRIPTIVDRNKSAQIIRNAKREGFKVLYVWHDYNEEK